MVFCCPQGMSNPFNAVHYRAGKVICWINTKRKKENVFLNKQIILSSSS